jgi:hypothetical protein
MTSGLGLDRPHVRVADVLVLDVQHLHLLDVGIERFGIGSVLAENLADWRVREEVARETLEPLQGRRVPAVLAVGGGQGDELADELRVTQRQLQGDSAALRVAHHVGTLDLQGVQQRRRIVAELLV